MKTYTHFVSFSLVLTLLLGPASALLASENQPTVNNPVAMLAETLADHQAKVYHIEGSAQILKASSSSWEDLLKDAVISEGDKIRTPAGSYVDLYYDSSLQNRSRIPENSIAEFNQIEPTQVTLSDGSIFNMLEALPSASGYEVVTPTAVASVRGTVFSVNYNATESSDAAYVIQGGVEFFKRDAAGEVEKTGPVFYLKAYDTVTCPKNKFDSSIRPRMMTTDETVQLETTLSSVDENMISYAGGSSKVEEAAQSWSLLKADLHKLDDLRGSWDARKSSLFSEKGRSQTTKDRITSSSGSGKSENVVVSGTILTTPEEEALQERLLLAEKSVLGGSSETKKKSKAEYR